MTQLLFKPVPGFTTVPIRSFQLCCRQPARALLAAERCLPAVTQPVNLAWSQSVLLSNPQARLLVCILRVLKAGRADGPCRSEAAVANYIGLVKRYTHGEKFGNQFIPP